MECGSSCVYADDLNAMGEESQYRPEKLEKKIKEQGDKIENTLQKLLLMMNNDKTQFIVCTHSQRRKASRLSFEERKKREAKIVTEIGGETITEGSEVRTLGVKFDSYLRFEPYWREVRGKIMKKLYGLKQIKSHLTFRQRKQLGSSLVISRLSYCIEATSCCTKSVLNIPKRVLNRTTRVVTNNWDYDDTKQNYKSLAWMELDELVVWRTYKMAKKMLVKGNPQKMLRRMATKSNDTWEIDPPKNHRTKLGRRSFTSRV